MSNLTGPRQFPLAVLLPTVGLPSETFIRNHTELLAPRQTVILATENPYQGDGAWETSTPTFQVRGPALSQRILFRLLRLSRVPHLGWTFRNRQQSIAVVEILKRHRVSVVLAEYLDRWAGYVPTLADAGISVFGHAHGYDVSQTLREEIWRNRYAMWNKADGVIVPSRHAQERLIRFGMEEERIHVIPCGVRVPEIFSRKRGSSEGPTHCIAVGRMVNKKNPLKTLEVFRTARATLGEDLKLTYVGGGPLFEFVATSVKNYGLDDCVTLLGAQPNHVVKNLLQASDIFLQHSMADPETGDEEGLPVAILEAMAAGLPIISTRHAGIPEAVEEGSNGLLVDEGDVSAMAEALVKLAQDPSRRATMGKAGWQLAKEKFALEHEVYQLRRLLGLENPGASS